MEDILVGALDPVGVVATALGPIVVVFGGGGEAGDDALVGHAVPERVHPAVHFPLARRPPQVSLVVGLDTHAFALGAGGEAEGDVVGSYAPVEGIDPAGKLASAGGATEQIVIHAEHPA